MKNIITVLIIAFALFDHCASAQVKSIQKLQIIPANPTNTDEIKVICYSNFPNSNCKMDTAIISINNYHITIHSEYEVGDATQPCVSIDTISVGTLAVGNYILRYILSTSDIPEDSAVDSVSFTVTQSTEISRKTGIMQNILIYPNPAQDIIYITPTSVNQQPLMAELYSMDGKKILTKHLLMQGREEASLSLAGVKPGMYILRLQNREGVMQNKILVKQP